MTITKTTRKPPAALVPAGEPGGALSQPLQECARRALAAGRAGGQALLDQAAALAEARQLAKRGEWSNFLVAIRINDRAAQRLVAIHERATADQRFADAVVNGWFSFTTAALVARADDDELTRALELASRPTRAQLAAEKPDTGVGFLAEDDDPEIDRRLHALHALGWTFRHGTPAGWIEMEHPRLTYRRQERPLSAALAAAESLQQGYDRADDLRAGPDSPAPDSPADYENDKLRFIDTPRDLADRWVGIAVVQGKGYQAHGVGGPMSGWSSSVGTLSDAISAARDEVERRAKAAPASAPSPASASPGPAPASAPGPAPASAPGPAPASTPSPAPASASPAGNPSPEPCYACGSPSTNNRNIGGWRVPRCDRCAAWDERTQKEEVEKAQKVWGRPGREAPPELASTTGGGDAPAPAAAVVQARPGGTAGARAEAAGLLRQLAMLDIGTPWDLEEISKSIADLNECHEGTEWEHWIAVGRALIEAKE